MAPDENRTEEEGQEAPPAGGDAVTVPRQRGGQQLPPTEAGRPPGGDTAKPRHKQEARPARAAGGWIAKYKQWLDGQPAGALRGWIAARRQWLDGQPGGLEAATIKTFAPYPAFLGYVVLMVFLWRALFMADPPDVANIGFSGLFTALLGVMVTPAGKGLVAGWWAAVACTLTGVAVSGLIALSEGAKATTHPAAVPVFAVFCTALAGLHIDPSKFSIGQPKK
jgi:hypothetical protein